VILEKAAPGFPSHPVGSLLMKEVISRGSWFFGKTLTWNKKPVQKGIRPDDEDSLLRDT